MTSAQGPLDPLTPQVFAILLALGDQPRHGYGILKDVEACTGGEVALLPGSLYSALRRMLEAGWIEEVEGAVDGDDPRRRYYGLTAAGRERARAESRRMSTLLRVAAEKRLAEQP
jgi:DNA-binding PadR family transcriptional regulator